MMVGSNLTRKPVAHIPALPVQTTVLGRVAAQAQEVATLRFWCHTGNICMGLVGTNLNIEL